MCLSFPVLFFWNQFLCQLREEDFPNQIEMHMSFDIRRFSWNCNDEEQEVDLVVALLMSHSPFSRPPKRASLICLYSPSVSVKIIIFSLCEILSLDERSWLLYKSRIINTVQNGLKCIEQKGFSIKKHFAKLPPNKQPYRL